MKNKAKFLDYKDFPSLEISEEIKTLSYCPNHFGHGSRIFITKLEPSFTQKLTKVKNQDPYRIKVEEIKPLLENLETLWKRRGGKPLKFRNIRYVDIITCLDFYRLDKDTFLVCSNLTPLWWRNMTKDNLRGVNF